MYLNYLKDKEKRPHEKECPDDWSNFCRVISDHIACAAADIRLIPLTRLLSSSRKVTF
jgi:hypothetical protein